MNNVKYRVKKVLDVRSGVSQSTGNEWRTRDVVLEDTAAVMYPDVVAATLKGEGVERFMFKEGDVIEVELSFFAHEHDGRWFNNVVMRNFSAAEPM